MTSVVAIMIVFLIIGIAMDALFGVANKAIRRRWGLEQALLQKSCSLGVFAREPDRGACNLIPPFDDISRRGVLMEHGEAVVTAAEPELDEALANAIRQLIAGALDADARSRPRRKTSHMQDSLTIVPSGCSSRVVKAASQRAARAPSSARWSIERVQRITVATVTAPSVTTGCCFAAPTARRPDCGGLMIPENSRVPYMPRFETESVPPSSSSCRSRRSLARPARSCDSLAISDRRFPSTPRSTGVTSPPSVATAIDISTEPCSSMPSSLHVTLASGTSRNAAPAAMTTKSLTEILTGELSLMRLRSSSSSSTTHSVTI